MHPELQNLDQQYRVLAENLRNGHVSQAEAASLIANMQAFDGQGFVWSLDPFTGNFMRGLPGQSPVPTDPSLFAPAQLPRTTMPSYASDPADMRVNPLSAATFQQAPYAARSRSRAMSLLGTIFGTVVGTLFGGLGGLLHKVLRGKLRTILVIVVSLAVAGYFVTRSSVVKDSPSVTVATTFPSVPPATIEIPATPTVPPEVVVVSLPSRAALNALSGILNDGSRQKLSNILPTDPATKLALTALVGAPRAGFAISLGDAVLVNGAVTVPASVLSDAIVVESWSLTLAPLGARWQVVSAVKVA